MVGAPRGDAGECEVLRSELAELPCADRCREIRVPAYFERKEPRGCWLAHVLLCMVELKRLLPRLSRFMRRRSISVEDLAWTVALHDVGKLTDEYQRQAFPQHNVLSALLSFYALRESGVGKDRALMIARAIFLHHEARHWRDLYRRPLAAHLISTVLKVPRLRLIDRAEEVLALLEEGLRRLGLPPLPSGWRRVAGRALSLPADEQGVLLEDLLTPPFSYEAASWRAFVNSLSLYRILWLVDNRAASARGGIDNYWRRQLAMLHVRAEDPIALADAILHAGRGLAQIALTMAGAEA